ncbi:MAG: hypothetical protein ACTJHU_11195, partial [Mycetocola sp.]
MTKRTRWPIRLRRESLFSLVLAAVWMVFLYYPANALGRGDLPLIGIIWGWIALISFALIYLGLFALMGQDGPGRGPRRPFL